MTKPKRWPHNAEAARVESVAAARHIRQHCEQAIAALRNGYKDLALYHVAESKAAATEIESALQLVKQGQ